MTALWKDQIRSLLDNGATLGTPTERMKMAVAEYVAGKISANGAATKYRVPRSSILDRAKKQ